MSSDIIGRLQAASAQTSLAALNASRSGLRIQTKPTRNVQFPGYELDPLNSLTGWTPTTVNGAAIVPGTLSDGSAGIVFNMPAAASAQAYIQKNVSIPYDQTTTLGLWVDFSDIGALSSLQVAISNESGTFTNWNILGYGGSSGVVFNGSLYFISLPISKATVGGGSFATAGTIQTVRIRVLGTYKNQAATIKFRSLNIGKMGRPKLCIAFDDGYASQFTEGFRYMSRCGMVGTIAVVSSFVGTASHMTLAQLQTMRAAGWAIVGHSADHAAFNSKSTNSIALAQTPSGAGNLTLSGAVGGAVFDAPRCLVFRTASDQGLKYTITGIGEDGVTVTTETLYSWTASFPVPSAKVYTQVTSIAVDQAAAGTITVGHGASYAEALSEVTASRDYLLTNGLPEGAYHFVFPQGEFNLLSQRALVAAGIKSARVVSGQMQQPAAGDFHPYQLPGYGGGGSGITNTVMSAWRTDAINAGGTQFVYMHDLATTASDSTKTAISEFQAFIDATAADVATGKIDVITQLDVPVA